MKFTICYYFSPSMCSNTGFPPFSDFLLFSSFITNIHLRHASSPLFFALITVTEGCEALSDTIFLFLLLCYHIYIHSYNSHIYIYTFHVQKLTFSLRSFFPFTFIGGHFLFNTTIYSKRSVELHTLQHPVGNYTTEKTNLLYFLVG